MMKKKKLRNFIVEPLINQQLAINKPLINMKQQNRFHIIEFTYTFHLVKNQQKQKMYVVNTCQLSRRKHWFFKGDA